MSPMNNRPGEHSKGWFLTHFVSPKIREIPKNRTKSRCQKRPFFDLKINPPLGLKAEKLVPYLPKSLSICISYLHGSSDMFFKLTGVKGALRLAG